jgi:hypothetical protein
MRTHFSKATLDIPPRHRDINPKNRIRDRALWLCSLYTVRTVTPLGSNPARANLGSARRDPKMHEMCWVGRHRSEREFKGDATDTKSASNGIRRPPCFFERIRAR